MAPFLQVTLHSEQYSVVESCVVQGEAWTDTVPDITVFTKAKSLLEKSIHYILKSDSWQDSDLNL